MVQSYDPNRALVLVRNPNFKEWSREAQPEGYPDDDRRDLRQHGRGQHHRDRERHRRLGLRPAARGPAQRDRHEVRRPGARQPADRVLVPRDEHPAGAVRQRAGPPGGQLGARPGRRGEDLRRRSSSPSRSAPCCRPASPATSTPATTPRAAARPGPRPTWTRPSSSSRPPAPPARRSGSSCRTTTSTSRSASTCRACSPRWATRRRSSRSRRNIQFTYIQNTNNKVQISLTQWYQDYPAASDFLNVLLSCASFHEGSDSSINISGFCDPGIEAQDQGRAARPSSTDGLSAADAEVGRRSTRRS